MSLCRAPLSPTKCAKNSGHYQSAKNFGHYLDAGLIATLRQRSGEDDKRRSRKRSGAPLFLAVLPRSRRQPKRNLTGAHSSLLLAQAAVFLRFLRQPSKPSAPKPVAKRGRAAGSGVAVTTAPKALLVRLISFVGSSPFASVTAT